MDVTIDIPDWLVARIGLTEADLERRVLEAMLAEAYRAGRVNADEREKLAHEIAALFESRPAPRDEELQGKRCDRQVFSTADMPEEIVEEILNAKMDPRHDHLNALLDGDMEFEALEKESRRRRVGLAAELPEEWIEALKGSEP